MKPTLLVLAAGMGSRYGGLKQIDPVGPCGEAVLDYSVFDARRAGFGKAVFVIRHDIEDAFRETVGSRFEAHLPVDYAFQEMDKLPLGFKVPAERQKPWGTGHAILCAKEKIDTPFAVINADDFYGADAYRVLAAELVERTKRDRYCMVGFRLGNTLSENGTVYRGLCTADRRGFLQDVEELTGIARTPTGARQDDGTGGVRELTGDELVSMNMWGFHPSLFEHLDREFTAFLQARGQEPRSEFYIPSVVNSLVKSGQVNTTVLQTGSSWFGVTYREDKPVVVRNVQRLVDAGEYPAPLWA